MPKGGYVFWIGALVVLVFNLIPYLWQSFKDIIGENVVHWSIFVLCVISDALILSRIPVQNKFLELVVSIFGTLGWIMLISVVFLLIQWLVKWGFRSIYGEN